MALEFGQRAARVDVMNEVRHASETDIPTIAVSLARAFADDPLSRWIVPRARRSSRTVSMFGLMLGVQLGLGETYTTPDAVAAAVWAPPDRWRLDAEVMTGLADHFVAVLGPHLSRALEAFAAMEAHHPADPPHWYLATLGTHPDWQGRGIGAALLKTVLRRADAEGVPAYLESSKDLNISYYRRFGFEVTGEIVLPGDGPTLWPMWREPMSG